MTLLNNDTLLLRAPEPEDLTCLYRWENDADIWRRGATLTPFSRFTLRKYLSDSLTQDIFQTRQLRLMIIEKASGQPIGTLDLYDFEPIHHRAGIGLLLDAAHRQRGHGLQALQLLHTYAAQILHLVQLYAWVPVDNLPSHRLFLKAGYREAGRLQAWLKTPEGFADAYLMQRLLGVAP